MLDYWKLKTNPQWIGSFLCKKLANTIDTRVGELYTISKTKGENL